MIAAAFFDTTLLLGSRPSGLYLRTRHGAADACADSGFVIARRRILEYPLEGNTQTLVF